MLQILFVVFWRYQIHRKTPQQRCHKRCTQNCHLAQIYKGPLLKCKSVYKYGHCKTYSCNNTKRKYLLPRSPFRQLGNLGFYSNEAEQEYSYRFAAQQSEENTKNHIWQWEREQSSRQFHSCICQSKKRHNEESYPGMQP